MTPNEQKAYEFWNKKFHEHFGNVYDYDIEHTKWWIEQIAQARADERRRIGEMITSNCARFEPEICNLCELKSKILSLINKE